IEVPLVRPPAPLTAWICAVLAPLCPIAITAARGEESPSLRLEAKIPLGQVSGRIDHMAVDLPRERRCIFGGRCGRCGRKSLSVVRLIGEGSFARRVR